MLTEGKYHTTPHLVQFTFSHDDDDDDDDDDGDWKTNFA